MEFLSFLDPRFLISSGGLIGVTAIIFAETGLLVGFFFPGDSLLFTAGFLASQQYLDIRLLVPLLIVGSIAGNMVGYAFGKRVGPRIFSREDSLLFHKQHLEKAQTFFAQHGGRAIFFARFFPIIRTFTPILAGVGGMNYKTFQFYNIVGGVVWVTGLTMLGYILGNAIPDIDKYLLPIIGGIVFISLLPGLVHLVLERRKKSTSAIK